jgi:5-formyltetrahydrofolate cyclo-ligase
MSEKELLRAEARRRLREAPEAELALAGAHIESAIWALPEVKSARTILLYASLGSEVPTDSIAEEARLRGIAVAYPRCLPGEPEMTLHLVSSGDHLHEGGRFGIREPRLEAPTVGVEAIDVALVPGLGWDRSGGRIGRGAGYYDRLLGSSGWRGFVCGLMFAAQEFPSIPMEPWDRRLDALVSERETLRFDGGIVPR